MLYERNHERGQSLSSFALVLVLLVVIAIAVFIVIAPILESVVNSLNDAATTIENLH